MAFRKGSLETKKRILSVCVRLFLQQGYHKTTVAQILHEAQVSASSFQNIFRAKDGVLIELVEFMFGGQFGTAKRTAGDKTPPVYIYAAETAMQLALTELNENLRDIYIEAYTQQETLEFIYEHTAVHLHKTFGANFPGFTQQDFYELDIGTAGLMRGYMAKKCDIHFPLEKKIERFLSLSLRAYRVPEDEIGRVLAYVASLDLRAIADGLLHKLLAELELRFEFTL